MNKVSAVRSIAFKQAGRRHYTLTLDGLVLWVAGSCELPSLVKEGWTRHQVNGPVPLTGAAGVVCSTSRSHLIDNREALLLNSVRYASIYKEASRHLQTTPAAPAEEASRHLLDGRSHPS